MTYIVSFYHMRLFSDGLDATETYETEAEAIREARAAVKRTGGAAHAVITHYGYIVATVINSKGRTLTKRAKQRR